MMPDDVEKVRALLVRLAALDICVACANEGMQEQCAIHAARMLAGQIADALGMPGKEVHREAKAERKRLGYE